jgi:hypothetical protein
MADHTKAFCAITQSQPLVAKTHKLLGLSTLANDMNRTLKYIDVWRA